MWRARGLGLSALRLGLPFQVSYNFSRLPYAVRPILPTAIMMVGEPCHWRWRTCTAQVHVALAAKGGLRAVRGVWWRVGTPSAPCAAASAFALSALE
jgi:hypothetical protein